MTLCNAWLTRDDAVIAKVCGAGSDSEAILDQALLVASDLLYQGTRSRWPGLCTDTVWPCATSSGAGSAQRFDDGLGARPLPGGISCSVAASGAPCGGHQWIGPLGAPIVDVVEVVIAGEVVAVDVRVGNDAYITRTDGTLWPCCGAGVGGPDDGPDAFRITYRWGAMPTPAGVAAADRLAAELYASWDPTCSAQSCLPDNFASLVREGVTIQGVQQIVGEATTYGMPEVDRFLTVANAGAHDSNDQGGRVLSTAGFAERPARIR